MSRDGSASGPEVSKSLEPEVSRSWTWFATRSFLELNSIMLVILAEYFRSQILFENAVNTAATIFVGVHTLTAWAQVTGVLSIQKSLSYFLGEVQV